MFKIGQREIKIVFMLLLSGGIIYFLILVKGALLPFIFGILLSYLFNPMISFLRQKNISRPSAFYIIIMFFLFTLSIIALLIIPVFIDELESLTVMIPKYTKSIEDYFDRLNQEYHRINMPLIIKEAIDRTLKRFEEQLINFLQNLTEVILNSLSLIFSLLIAPIISYYILKDLEKLKKGIMDYIPPAYRRYFLILGVEINKVFIGYLRGQIWVSIIIGCLVSIGLIAFRIRFYIILGIFAGITNMIPYIGPIIGAIPAAFIALLSSPMQALGVIILYFLIQQLEGSIISPKIMSEKVGLHPLTIFFALLAGAELFGVWGLLFAVPLAGSVKVIIRFIRFHLLYGEKAQ